jgi:Flavodoxin domain
VKALVVYESMFGNTRLIADAAAEGLRTHADVQVVGVAAAEAALGDFDLVVVGSPTHAWGMPWPSTRRSAPIRAHKPGSALLMEQGANTGPGVREWLASVGHVQTQAAAFDTRIKSAVFFTGRASKGISRQLARHGLLVISPPESFFVDKESHLLAGEVERAWSWGAHVAAVACRSLSPGR